MEDSCELLVLMSGGMQGLEDGKALDKSLGTVDIASLGKMLGSEDGTVSVGLEDGSILGKTEDGASLGKMLEDGKVLGRLLGTEVGVSLGKRLVLEDGTVFVRSGGMLGLEDGKELGKSLGREVDT